MTIRLNWINRNTDYDEIRIYRDTERFDTANLPEPIDVIGPADYYDDTTALRNVVYYYALGIVKGNDEVVSPIKVLANMPYTGPGRQTPLRGDYERGYFGTLTASELFASQELADMVGLTEGSGLDDTYWHKFIDRGRILFIPHYPLRRQVRWDTLYNLGLVFGVQGPGPDTVGLPAVEQWRTVLKDDHEFVVRLPRSSSSADYTMVVGLQDHESEWYRLFEPLLRDSGLVTPYPRWGDSDIISIHRLPVNINLLSWFAEHNGVEAAWGSMELEWRTYGYAGGGTVQSSWRPVLELLF